ncbi:MAG: hypothetical protein ACRELY_14820 [Polyangiaceae bacterium]
MKISTLALGLALGSAIWMSPATLHAQTAATTGTSVDEPDSVTLKHGGMIKGRVTEILPGDHATVAMSNGQNAIIRWEEIGSISRGGTLIKMDTPPPPAPPPPATATPAATPQPVPGAFYGPEKMPYEDGEPIPQGYHVESHKKLGLLITGAILTGIGAAGILAYDLGNHTGDEKEGFDILWGLLFLGPGLPLLLVGIIANPQQLVRNDVGKLELPKIAPRPSPFFFSIDPRKDHAGIKLGFTF